MADRDNIALAAAHQAARAAANLIGFAADSEDLEEEIVEIAADAVKLAIEAKGGPGGEHENQLYGALVRFLEGWAG